jgi:hypothetical protein
MHVQKVGFSVYNRHYLETFCQLSSLVRSFAAGSLIIACFTKFILCIIFRFSSYGHHLCHTEGLFRRLSVPETKEFQNGDRGSPGIHRIFIVVVLCNASDPARVAGSNWVHGSCS